MSELELPSPIPHAGVSPSDDSIQPDPLLGSGSFIEPVQENLGNENHEPAQFETDWVIDAKSISMLVPGSCWTETTPRVPKVRDPEEMAKRPIWLPDDWKLELKVRGSGATAGTIDRYYVAPSGQPKLRSKNEVLRYLELEDTPKRRQDSVEPASGSSWSRKRTKSSSLKHKKSAAVAT